MNDEVLTVVEKNEETKDEGCTECVVVELGEVSKDTLGGFGGWLWDPGINFRM